MAATAPQEDNSPPFDFDDFNDLSRVTNDALAVMREGIGPTCCEYHRSLMSCEIISVMGAMMLAFISETHGAEGREKAKKILNHHIDLADAEKAMGTAANRQAI